MTTLSHRLRPRSAVWSTLVLSLAALALTSCTTTQKERANDIGRSYVPLNVTRLPAWPADIRRVAVLPVADATRGLPLEFIATFDGPWLQALQHSQRAEFVAVRRDTYQRWTGTPRPPASTALLPADWADRIRAGTAADAALLVDLTHCSPYPPLALGLRAKLVRLDTQEIVWSADELFDAADPLVARAARRHARAGQIGREADAVAVLQSPSRFAAYAADALSETLPPR